MNKDQVIYEEICPTGTILSEVTEFPYYLGTRDGCGWLMIIKSPESLKKLSLLWEYHNKRYYKAIKPGKYRQKDIDFAEKQANHFTHFEDRKVISSYRCEKGNCVIVSGAERGCWFDKNIPQMLLHLAKISTCRYNENMELPSIK